MAKFKRRPNKSGTVVKLSGKRSKPYMAKITTGYSDIDGSQIQKPLGYFENREDALNALALYNLSKNQKINDQQLQQLGGSLYQSITNFNNHDLPTFKDIYIIILNKELANLTKSRIGAYNAAFKRLSKLHNKQINSISLFDMQECIDKSKLEVGSKVLFDMKTICTKIFEYAVIHQYIKRDQDFTSYLDASKKDSIRTKHKPFSLEEIKRIKQYDTFESRICLIYLLTGARPIELLDNFKKENVFIDVIEDGHIVSYIITGSKTNTGKNRIIPIHNYIKPFFLNTLVKLNQEVKGQKTQYYQNNYFNVLMKELNYEGHTPYDTRHTFASLAKLNGVDDFYRKRIMGHKSKDITDDVYTHTFKFKLFEEINKIKIL